MQRPDVIGQVQGAALQVGSVRGEGRDAGNSKPFHQLREEPGTLSHDEISEGLHRRGV
jgi:hypothetical protein